MAIWGLLLLSLLEWVIVCSWKSIFFRSVTYKSNRMKKSVVIHKNKPPLFCFKYSTHLPGLAYSAFPCGNVPVAPLLKEDKECNTSAKCEGVDLKKEREAQREKRIKNSDGSRGSQCVTVSQLGTWLTHAGCILIQSPLMTCERLLPAPSKENTRSGVHI